MSKVIQIAIIWLGCTAHLTQGVPHGFRAESLKSNSVSGFLPVPRISPGMRFVQKSSGNRVPTLGANYHLISSKQQEHTQKTWCKLRTDGFGENQQPSLSLGRRGIRLKLASDSGAGGIDQMSSAELKSRLRSLGIPHSDCFEKSELQIRFREATYRQSNQAQLISDMFAAGGVLLNISRPIFPSSRSDGEIDQKGHFAIRLHLYNFGVDADFILDTGSSSSVIDASFAQRINAPHTGRGAVVCSASENDTVAPEYSLGEVGVNGVRYGGEGVRLGFGQVRGYGISIPVDEARGEERPGGIIGLDLLSKYQILFDFKALHALFLPLPQGLSVSRMEESMVRVPLVYDDEMLILYTKACLTDALTQSATLPAILDMGSQFSIANWRALESLGKAPGSEGVGEPRRMVYSIAGPGEDGSMPGMLIHEVCVGLRLEAGCGMEGVRLGPLRLGVTDMPALALLPQDGGMQGGMLLGLDALSSRDLLLLDLAALSLWFPR